MCASHERRATREAHAKYGAPMRPARPLRLLALALTAPIALAPLAACSSKSTASAPSGDDGGAANADGGDAGAFTPPTCSTPVAADPLAASRDACMFAAGALAKDTLGVDDAARAKIPIKHVIVMMKENRSFDHIFGGIHAVQPDAEVFPPSFSNKDMTGNDVTP